MSENDTKYSALFGTLRADILGGKYALGKPFPSERALISRFKLSRNTVQHVLHDLVADGLLTSRRGAGYFVTKSAVSRKIGLLVPREGISEFFQPVIGEISRLAQQAGYSLQFGEMPAKGPEGRARATVRLAKNMVKQGVAGVIFQPNDGVGDAESINGTVATIFRNAGVALVLCDYDMVTPPARSEFDVVGSNNFEAGMRLAMHLIESGAKRILFVLPPNPAASHIDRCRGAVALTTSRNGNCRCETFESSPDDVTAFRRKFRQNRPDAIICCNDKCAAELLRTLDKLKIRVPGDMMLAGFDDISIASLTIPSLTTIHQPCAKIAKAAFDRLLARMKNPGLDPMKITLDAPLVIRESTMRA